MFLDAYFTADYFTGAYWPPVPVVAPVAASPRGRLLYRILLPTPAVPNPMFAYVARREEEEELALLNA